MTTVAFCSAAAQSRIHSGISRRGFNAADFTIKAVGVYFSVLTTVSVVTSLFGRGGDVSDA